MRQALAAVAEAKGRVTKSELKQHSAGQFSAVLQFEVAPEAAGPLRDRLKQLGNMVRLEIDRVQQAEGGTAPPPRDAKVAARRDALRRAAVQPRQGRAARDGDGATRRRRRAGRLPGAARGGASRRRAAW